MFNHFKPHNKQEALLILTTRYPADKNKLRRMNYLQLYAINESIHRQSKLSPYTNSHIKEVISDGAR